MNIFSVIDAAFSGRPCLALLHSIWQFGFVAIISYVFSRTWQRRKPDTEYVVHVAAMLVGLLAFAVTFSLVRVTVSEEYRAGETASAELLSRDLPQLQDPFVIEGTAVGADGVQMMYGGVGLHVVGDSNKLRSRGGGIDSRGFALRFGTVNRLEPTVGAPYGVGTVDVEPAGNNKRLGYTLLKRTPDEPLRITDDPDQPELKDGIRYIRPGKPMKFELIFTKTAVDEDGKKGEGEWGNSQQEAEPKPSNKSGRAAKAKPQDDDADSSLPADFKEVAMVFDSGKALLDLDSDDTLGPMARGDPSDVAKFDLFVSWEGSHQKDGEAICALSAQLHKLVQVSSAEWKAATAGGVVVKLATTDEAQQDTPQILAKQGDKESSFWFIQTKQSGIALIQIEYKDRIETEFSGKRKGFVVQYQLVPAILNDTAAAPRSMMIHVVDAKGNALRNARIFRNHVYKLDGVDTPKIENETYITDMGGQAEVKLSGETVDLRLWAARDGYVRMHAMWAEKLQSDGNEIPDEFIFKLPTGTTIGGRVIDENGKPIASVKVEVQDKAAAAFHSIMPGQPGQRPVRDYTITGSKGVLTDADGRWKVQGVASDDILGDDEGTFRRIELRITHPDYHGDDTPINRSLSDENQWGEIQRAQSITRASLRDQSSVIKLKRRAAADAKFSKRWPWPRGTVDTVTIDTHFVNEVKLQNWPGQLVLDSDELIEKTEWTDVPDFENWKKTTSELVQKQAIKPRDATPMIKVVQFGEDQLTVKIVRPIARYRWHHYYGVGMHLRITRSPEVDRMFDLEKLEEKYLTRYKGVGYGTSQMEARKKLGEPEYTEFTSAVGWYTDYYLDGEAVIFYQNLSVASATSGFSDSVKEAIANSKTVTNGE